MNIISAYPVICFVKVIKKNLVILFCSLILMKEMSTGTVPVIG